MVLKTVLLYVTMVNNAYPAFGTGALPAHAVLDPKVAMIASKMYCAMCNIWYNAVQICYPNTTTNNVNTTTYFKMFPLFLVITITTTTTTTTILLQQLRLRLCQ